MSLRFHLDEPKHFDLPSRALRMRGWAFFPGRALRGVRLEVNSVMVAGTYGLSRPDVKAAMADANNEAGFELRAPIPSGRSTATLQFQDEHGEWITAANLQVTSPRWTLPVWLGGENPADLLEFQLAVRAQHHGRPISPEKFPVLPRTDATQPRLSIVTPSYQQGQYLAQTIASVLDQSGAEIEYVIQDGGSADGSVELIKSQAHRLKAWQSAHDAGQVVAISAGFAKTSGGPEDVMAWLNSDDFYLPGALAYVSRFFALHPEVDVLYGHRLLVDERSEEIGRWYLPQHNPEVLRLNDFVPQETMFWRRRIWDRVGGLDPTFQFAMDWDLLLRFQAAGAKIVRVPRFLAGFRIHPAQKTSAQIRSVGQQEIDRLRRRTFGREITPAEIEQHPALISYLRKSAWLQFANRFGYRGPAG